MNGGRPPEDREPTTTPLDQPATSWRRLGALYILAALFIVSLAAHFVLTGFEVAQDNAMHGYAFSWSDTFLQWGRGVFENLQSEWAQLLLQGVLFALAGERLFTAASRMEGRRHAQLLRELAIVRRDLHDVHNEMAQLRAWREDWQRGDG